MSNKSLLKFGAAFVLLAAVLIFLGVNFVPRIYASSSAQRNVVVAGKQTRPVYRDEDYPRAILDLRNPQANVQSVHYFTGSDSIVQNPVQLNQWVNDSISESIERITVQPTQMVKYFTGSDSIVQNPVQLNQWVNDSISDSIEHQPPQPSR